MQEGGYARRVWAVSMNAYKPRGADQMNTSSKMNETEILRVELEVMRQEHSDLDDAIQALHDRPIADPLTLQRLKKNKLRLKDKMAQLEDRITPDIIA